MNTEHIGYRVGLCLAGALLLGGCGDGLAPAWEVRAFRLFAAKIENLTRAAPPKTPPGVTQFNFATPPPGPALAAALVQASSEGMLTSGALLMAVPF